MSFLAAFLLAVYILGVFALVSGMLACLTTEVDRKWVKSLLPFKPKNNITLLLVAVLLISVWPVCLLKPIYNWMKAPV